MCLLDGSLTRQIAENVYLYCTPCAHWMLVSPTDLVFRISLTRDADVSYGPKAVLT